MASEAELERLYQEFVSRGGGAFTLSNVNTTPAQYYNTVSSSTLTPLNKHSYKHNKNNLIDKPLYQLYQAK